jgi:hypothetical protein
MALTIAHECRAAALNGITALLNSGLFKLKTSGASVLATLTFNATAFASATTASPSTALSNSITAASSPTAGTISLFSLDTSGGSARIAGTVGVGSGDISVSDNVIPVGTTSVTCAGGLTLSLQLA